MKQHLNGYWLAAGATLVATIGCGSTPVPRELVDARTAYTRAASGDAARLSPAAVNDAQASLARAEKSYQNDEDEAVIRAKSYIALRKAEMADVLASTEKAREAETAANMQESRNRSAQNAQQERLEATEDALEQSNTALQSESARAESERKARIAVLAVAKAEGLAIKDEPRGTVITVKVPFKTGKSDLPPQATSQLDPLADALKQTKNREILVEGHTDSQGAAATNKDLSQRRAESVREYLISREVPPERVSATGVGEENPPDDNKTAEGRANNRVVQIVVKGQPPPESE